MNRGHPGSRRGVAIALLVAAFVTTIGVGVWRSSLRDTARAPTAGNLSAERGSGSLESGGSLSHSGADAVESERTAPESRVDGTAVSGASEVVLSGTITVEDEQGRTHATESGSFLLIVRSGNHGTGSEVEVREGRWTARVARGESLDVYWIRLGDRPAVLRRWSLPFPDDGSVAIHARWARSTSLRVLDDKTRKHLDGITVVHLERTGRWGVAHPGRPAEVQRLVHNGRSPIAIPAHGLGRGHWVRAEGYAWALINIDPPDGGEQSVLLRPGGSARIQLMNFRPESTAVVRLRSPATRAARVRGRPLGEFEPSEDGVVEFDGFPTGEYEVDVELGSWIDRTVSLGRATLRIEAGELSSVTIPLQDPPRAPDVVRVRGEIELPRAWGKPGRRPHLLRHFDGHEFEPMPVVVSTGEDGVLRWDARDVPAGRYTLAGLLEGFEFVFESGPDSEGPRFALPEPLEVLIRAVDRASGEPVRLERIEVWMQAGAVSAMWRHHVAVERNDSGEFRARLPQGRARIMIDSDDFVGSGQRGPVAAEVEVETTRPKIVLELVRPTGVRIRFRVDAADDVEVEVPDVSEFEPNVRPVNGDESAWLWRIGWDSQTYIAPRPGEYEIVFPKLPSFRAIQTRSVTVERNKVVDLDVPLTPAD